MAPDTTKATPAAQAATQVIQDPMVLIFVHAPGGHAPIARTSVSFKTVPFEQSGAMQGVLQFYVVS